MPRATVASKHAGISSAAVEKATGRSWPQWLKLLDAAGAAAMSHAEIAEHLRRRNRLSPWWSQSVTVGWEQARGRRQVHQKADGFAANSSKTVAVGLERLFDAWADGRKRRRWLGPAPIDVTRTTPSRSMRLLWTDDQSRVDVSFFAKGEARSQVTIQHRKLADAGSVSAMRAFWRERLEALAGQLGAAAAARPAARRR